MNEKSHRREYSLKEWSVKLITTAMVLGLILPLFAEVILGTFFPCKVKGVEIWNQFTSVILGIVATVLSLVSMFLGFKSYDDSFELQSTLHDTLNHVQNVEGVLKTAMRLMFAFQGSNIDSKINREGWSSGDPTEHND